MSESSLPSQAIPAPASPAPAPTEAGVASAAALPWSARTLLLLAVLALTALVALVIAWRTQDRVQALEQELVRRQQDSQTQATEATLLARQAQELSRDAVAKAVLLDARVAEMAIQRSQLEELIRSLTRSRDENLLADIDAAVRVALQQTGITGSAEPLLAALKSADERLARSGQPRLEAVRRAIARDIDRTQAVGVADLASLAMKLDEGVRLVDDAPLLVIEAPRGSARARTPAGLAASGSPPAATSASASPASALPGRVAPRPSAPTLTPAPSPVGGLGALLSEWGRTLWGEVTSLVRVTRIDQPEAMLLAPEQAYFLRENLKLKLLNARLALLSRQFDIAQADLQGALDATERHFDRNSRQTAVLLELLRSVSSQARHAGVPRPDNTLAALATVATR